MSEIQQRLRAAGLSLMGDGMLVRLRRTSIALVGVIAAVGLGLIIFISQLGFPDDFSSPLPGQQPTEVGTIHSGVALTQGPDVGSPRSAPGSGSSSASTPLRRGAPGSAADGGGPQGPQLAHPPEAQPNPTAPQPATPVSEPPTSQPAPPVAQPVSSPAPSPPASTGGSPQKSGAGGQSEGGSTAKAKPKSDGPAAAKLTSDGSGKSAIPSTVASKGQPPAKDTGRSSSRSKSGTSPVEKATRDASATTTTAAPVPAPPSAAPTAAAKEAADAGKAR